MEQGSAQTIAMFTGTLLKAERALGQRFVQLVFRENDQNWLCISSKLAHAKLTVGETYRIEGEFKKIGDREYIHEPRIAPVVKARISRRTRVVTGVVIAILLAVGAAYTFHKNTQRPAINNTASHSSAGSVLGASASDENATEQTPAAPAPDTPAPAPTPAASTDPGATDPPGGDASDTGTTDPAQTRTPSTDSGAPETPAQ